MAILPLAPILVWVFGLLSLALLGFGLFFFIGFLLGIVIPIFLLVLGVAMIAQSLIGRQLVLLAIGGKRGQDEPHPMRSEEVQEVQQPDGTKIHVEFYGPPDAQPLILTHGWTADSTDWYYMKQYLAKEYRLILWDLPGLGKSSHAAGEDYSLDKMATSLAAVLDAASPNRPAIIAGHSMGGMTILTFCKLFPQYLEKRVNGLILVNTTYTNPAKTALLNKVLKKIQKPIIEPALHLMKWLWPLVWLQNWMSYYNGTAHIGARLTSFSGQQTRGQLDYMTWLSAKHSPAVIARQMLGMLHYDATDVLEKINVPTLIITADKDIATLPQASEYMNKRMPQSRAITIKACGHGSIMEQNQQVNLAIGTFCSQLSLFQTLKN